MRRWGRPGDSSAIPGRLFIANVAELAALGSLGRLDQAAEPLARAHEVKPDLSIAYILTSLPNGAPEVQAKFLDALRAAGVSE